jgi:uncharacterized membrane protein
MTQLAAVSWGARLGWLHLENTWPAFLGFAATPYIVSLLAIAELLMFAKFSDRNPACEAGCLTCGGLEIRPHDGVDNAAQDAILPHKKSVAAIGGKDLPIALLEDAVAIGAAFWIISLAS